MITRRKLFAAIPALALVPFIGKREAQGSTTNPAAEIPLNPQEKPPTLWKTHEIADSIYTYLPVEAFYDNKGTYFACEMLAKTGANVEYMFKAYPYIDTQGYLYEPLYERVVYSDQSIILIGWSNIADIIRRDFNEFVFEFYRREEEGKLRHAFS